MTSKDHMSIKRRIQKIEDRTLKRKKPELDLSGLTNEELNILANTVEKENKTEEEEAAIIAIMSKVPEIYSKS